jgi:hypothetical protein
MQGIKQAITILIFVLALSVPKWSQAQDVLKPRNGTLQQSMRELVQASEPKLSAALFTRPADAIPVSTHERFATFLAGEDFNSVLLLENFRPDLPITFSPILIVSSGEVPLDPITVPAHSSTTVDISEALKNRGITDTRGTVAVRFDFTSYGAGTAVVEMRDEKHHLFLNSYAQSPEEYWNGTGYDAVVWAPHEGTQGFISVTNSSNEPHVVHTTFLLNGQPEQQPVLQIPPRQTRIFFIDDLLARSRKTAAGIHIEYEQEAGEKYPGAILVEGQIFNRKTAFAKHLRFIDKDLQYPTGTLRTHFLMLGRQPAEDNFPANLSFQSFAAVRNVDNIPVTITPTVKFLQNGSLQTISLPTRSLAPAESVIIDFNEEQKVGRLPRDFRQGSLALTPDTGYTSIVAELFNFSRSGDYVVGPSFSSYPNRSTASIWRTDGSFQTTIMVENTAAEDDHVTLHLYSEKGDYSKTFGVAAGKLFKINIRDLQQKGIADDHGNLLLDTSGVLSLIGGRNTRSKFSYDKIVHSADQADYVGLPPNPCDYVTVIGLFIDTNSGDQPFPVMRDYEWAIAGSAFETGSGASPSNSSLAQISNDGSGDMVTFSPPDDGLTHTVIINPPSNQELTQFCDACSSGMVAVVGASVGIRISTSYWGPPVTRSFSGLCFYGSLACTPGTTPTCRTGIGLGGYLTCPDYIKAEYLVVDGLCFGVHVSTAATGPGPCD